MDTFFLHGSDSYGTETMGACLSLSPHECGKEKLYCHLSLGRKTNESIREMLRRMAIPVQYEKYVARMKRRFVVCICIRCYVTDKQIAQYFTPNNITENDNESSRYLSNTRR